MSSHQRTYEIFSQKMNELRRQRSLTESITFAHIEPKNAFAPQLLEESLCITGLGQAETDKKKFSTEFASLRKALERAQSLYPFDGKFAQNALTSIDHDCLFVGTGDIKDFTPRKLLHLGGKISQSTDKLKKKKIVIWVDTFYKDVPKNLTPKDFAGRPLIEQSLGR